MKARKKSAGNVYPFASVLAIVPAALIQFIWMYTSSETTTFSERKSDFLSYFPVYFQHHNLVNGIAAGFSLLSLIVAGVGFKQATVAGRVMCFAVGLVALALGLLAVIRIYE